jgi:hypothetical protein
MTIKQLKVVNTTPLNAQGTFDIGLRDNLLIKPNSKVGLKKFLLQQKPVEVFAIDIGKQTFIFNPDKQGGGSLVSLPCPDRSITFGSAGLKFASLYDLAKSIQLAINNTLICGDLKKDIKPFVVQSSTNPTNDAGLEVSFGVNASSGTMEFAFNSYALSDVVKNSFEKSNAVLVNSERGFRVSDLTKAFVVKGSRETRLIKGSFQVYTQITQFGRAGYDYGIGLCEPSTTLAETHIAGNIPFSLSRQTTFAGLGAGWEWYVRDGTTKPPFQITYNDAVGDYVVFFVSEGKLNLAIYPLDTSIPFKADAFRAGAVPKYSYTFTNFSLESGTEYVPVISSEGIQLEATPIADRPQFSQFKSISTIDPKSITLASPNGVKRVITMDFTGAKQLSNQLGFSSSTLISPPSSNVIFSGSKDPNFNKILDLALFWSLPTQTYVATGDKTQNSKQNMIASFTPERQTTLSDTLYYENEITYVDIGNLNEMNISSLSFRLVNEFPNVLNNVPATDYLSFVLYIKDE